MEQQPYKNTLELFKCLSKIDSIDRCLLFCKPAVDTIQSRVKDPDIIVNDVHDLYFAAACLAFYRAALSDDLFKYSSFKAGSVSVNYSNQEVKDNSIRMLTMALEEAKPYLKTGTVFKSMGGGSL